MRCLAAKMLSVAASVATLVPSSSSGGQVCASFLQDTNVLGETAQLLVQNGCSKQGVSAFEVAVRHYFEEPLDLDFTSFPTPTHGTYCFPSSRDLLRALPHRLPETKHTFDLNCFDSVILLANGGLRTRLRPDDLTGPIMAPIQTTNGEAIELAATPRDAFTCSNPQWYREATETLIPSALREQRICLASSLFRWYLLPSFASSDNLAPEVLTALRTSWQRDKVHFPSRFELVLLHKVSITGHTICTCHAGLLLQHKGRYTYVEKAGGCGPFVRLDFGNKADLAPWLANAFTNHLDTNVFRFATFNDKTIHRLSL